jgi:hypothetical protein
MNPHPHPDPHRDFFLDPHPHFFDADPQHLFRTPALISDRTESFVPFYLTG